MLADAIGVLGEWLEALRECSYDPLEVAKESIRRLEEFGRVHGASRSGVDMADLVPPREDLSRRSRRVFQEV